MPRILHPDSEEEGGNKVTSRGRAIRQNTTGSCHSERRRPRKGKDSSPVTKLRSSKKRTRTDSKSASPGRKIKLVKVGQRHKVDENLSPLQFLHQSPIACACHYVGQELKCGTWPSPYWGSDRASGALMDYDDSLHSQHMEIVTASLEDFGARVVQPAIEARSSHQAGARTINEGGDNASPAVPRPFYAALLILRETLSQNAMEIFGQKGMVEALGEFGGQSPRVSQEELWYLAKTLATGVTIGAIERCLTPYEENATDAFLAFANGYDNGDDNFASCFTIRPSLNGDVRRVALENGSDLSGEEEIAKGVSDEVARKQHPTIQRNHEKESGHLTETWIKLPQATACHIVMVESRMTRPSNPI